MLANINLTTDLDIIGEKGRIVVIGSRGKIEIDPRKLMNTESFCTGVMLLKATDQEYQEMGAEIVQGIEDNWLNPIVDQEFPLEQASAVSEIC